MKTTRKLIALALAAMMLLTACGEQKQGTTDTPEQPENAFFEPKLDTEKAVSLEAAVFFGNFEAFDQVINHFNEIYPNVTITYEQVGGAGLAEYLGNNPTVDIFMTSTAKGYPTENCVDLLAAGVDVSAVADGLLDSNTVDGKLLSLPMGVTLKGMAVNQTLLEKEGLSVPQTWPEFLEVLEALQQKGYTPIQGPSTVIGSLGYDMGMTMLNSDPELLEALYSGEASAASALQPVYDRLQLLQDSGYISDEVNAEYPDDNYDGAIMKFFEGDVPFWVCDTEKYSGMKKRESKSESYSADPFSYEFIFAPMGDNGVYEYIEPWYGFSINTGSDEPDYAAEFLRFMARQDELNTLASVKGVPSSTKESADERYAGLFDTEKVEASAIYDGSIYSFVGVYLENTANDMLTGKIANADAAEHFVSRCAETVQEMQAN